MREEISAGGVVLFGNAILLLRKFNGDWVLPKGKVEEGENNEIDNEIIIDQTCNKCSVCVDVCPTGAIHKE